MRTRPTAASLTIAVCAMLLVAAVPARAQSNSNSNHLFVYGHGLAFEVGEPDGWHGDTKKIAAMHAANVIFLPFGEVHQGDISIRVRVSRKVDNNTIEDLNHDLEYYRNRFPNAQFTDLPVSNAEYKTFAGSISVPHRLYAYDAFVNPGPGIHFIFFVTMTKKKEPATEDELRAYGEVVSSLVWLYTPKR